jgi:hypothetical protein
MVPSAIAHIAPEVRARISESLRPEFIVDGRQQVNNALASLEFGDVNLADQFLSGALPLLQRELAVPVPDVLPRSWDGVPPDQRPLTDRLTRSEWYEYLGLCRWFLENRDDAELYRFVSEEMERFLVLKEEESAGRSFEWRDWSCRQFVAARDYRRLLKWMPDAPLLKKHQSGPMKMAWLLARHHVHGELTPAELDVAWKRFLDTNVPDWIERNRLLDLAVWMKARYWDGVEPAPDPYEAFLRFWDHLPGVARPRVVR